MSYIRQQESDNIYLETSRHEVTTSVTANRETVNFTEKCRSSKVPRFGVVLSCSKNKTPKKENAAMSMLQFHTWSILILKKISYFENITNELRKKSTHCFLMLKPEVYNVVADRLSRLASLKGWHLSMRVTDQLLEK